MGNVVRGIVEGIVLDTNSSTAGDGIGIYFNISVVDLTHTNSPGIVGVRGSVAGSPGELAFYTRRGSTGLAGEWVRINDIGNVGIGTTTPAYKLSVQSTSDGNMFQLYDTDGNCLQNPESGAITTTCTSDEKYKENIRDSGSMLDYFKDFKIREYEVKASGDTRIGPVAQELEITHPELVEDITSTSTFQVQVGTTTETDAEGTEKEVPMYETREAITTSKFVELPSIWQVIKAIQDVWTRLAGIFRFDGDKATGMTLYSQDTSEAYCLTIQTGLLIHTKGACK